MKITEIRTLPHKAGSYRVCVDKKPVGYISAKDISELKLAIGGKLEPETYTELLNRVKYNSFYLRAMRYADRRLRSKAEVRRFLALDNCPPELTEDIVGRLSGLGLIDDDKLAQAYIHDLKIATPMSRRLAEHKLQLKQIDQDTIDSVLDPSGYSDDDALDELIARKSQLSAYINNQPKFFRYLLSKGFSYEAISKRIGRPDVSGSNYGRRSRSGL